MRGGVAVRGREAGERSRVGKGPSEAPAIDQKFMSVAGIRPACPLFAFMCSRNKGGGAIEDAMEEGRTSEIATYSKRCPRGPEGPPSATISVIETRLKLDQSAQIARLVTPFEGHSAVIDDKASSQVAFVAATNESSKCS